MRRWRLREWAWLALACLLAVLVVAVVLAWPALLVRPPAP